VAYQQNANVAVWQSAKEHLEGAEILLDYNRLWPAVMLAALSIELSLKSFLAYRLAPWTATTQKGHSLVELFAMIGKDDRRDLLDASLEADPSLNFEQSIRHFDRLFERARYAHEPNAPKSIGSDVVYFARHVHAMVLAIARRRHV